MERQHTKTISSFFIAGINYKKSDASIRGQYAVGNDQYAAIIDAAPGFGISELMILSTCNRTEIYGFAENPFDLCHLLCSHTEGSVEDFLSMAYIKNGVEAIEHLFNVSSGLDSQILGDYEIVGQIKLAAKFSRQHDFLGPYLERLLNAVLQSSKKIRTTTGLSGGTVSVSFAAVQYIKALMPEFAGKKILMLGIGKIGSNTCKNLVDYLPATTVTLINRTKEKAQLLAEQFGLNYDAVENMAHCIDEADIILVATNSTEPVILKDHISSNKKKLIIDLSIPYNVAPDVAGMENVTLVNVDELSRIKDETLKKRAAEIPKVKLIIEAHVNEFLEWHEMRRHVPVLKAVKTQLLKMQTDIAIYSLNIFPGTQPEIPQAEERIQKVINGMALKMRTKNQRGCFYIEALNDFIAGATN